MKKSQKFEGITKFKKSKKVQKSKKSRNPKNKKSKKSRNPKNKKSKKPRNPKNLEIQKIKKSKKRQEIHSCSWNATKFTALQENIKASNCKSQFLIHGVLFI